MDGNDHVVMFLSKEYTVMSFVDETILSKFGWNDG